MPTPVEQETKCPSLKNCEVKLRFKIPQDKMPHIYNAINELGKVGITFDTGGTVSDPVNYDWELDWSLKGPVEVLFKKFKE